MMFSVKTIHSLIPGCTICVLDHVGYTKKYPDKSRQYEITEQNKTQQIHKMYT